MTSAARRRVPGTTRVYVAAVVTGTLLLLPLGSTARGLVHGPVAFIDAAILAGLIAVARRYPVQIGPKRLQSFSTAPTVTAVLLLPGLLAAATLALGTLVGEAAGRPPAIQRLFNTTLAALCGVVGAVAYDRLARLEPTEAAALLLTPVLLYVMMNVLVRGVVATQLRQSPLRRPWLPPQDLLLTEAALSITGIMAAVATATHGWMLPLLAVPAAIAQLAVRDSVALRAQSRLTEEALREAQAALAVRDEFLSSAAHELRTPLTSLKTYLQLACRRLQRGGMPPDAGGLLAEVDAQANRMTRLVGELLDISRLQAGRLEIERKLMDLGKVVQRIVDAQQALEPERVIEVVCPPELPPIMADEGRVEQVLTNLLENARKYSAVHRPICVCVVVSADHVDIAVRDQGVGIPAEEQDRIFERFHRGCNVDPNIPGLGIGLHIARELVEAHGGILSVKSVPGKGSTFTAALPRDDHLPAAGAHGN